MEKNTMSKASETQESQEQEFTNRYITLHHFFAKTEEELEKLKVLRKTHRCFLCNTWIQPRKDYDAEKDEFIQTDEYGATAIEIENYSSEGKEVHEYALFHEWCYDTLLKLFNAFFREFLHGYLIEDGLGDLCKEDFSLIKYIKLDKDERKKYYHHV